MNGGTTTSVEENDETSMTEVNYRKGGHVLIRKNIQCQMLVDFT